MPLTNIPDAYLGLYKRDEYALCRNCLYTMVFKGSSIRINYCTMCNLDFDTIALTWEKHIEEEVKFNADEVAKATADQSMSGGTSNIVEASVRTLFSTHINSAYVKDVSKSHFTVVRESVIGSTLEEIMDNYNDLYITWDTTGRRNANAAIRAAASKDTEALAEVLYKIIGGEMTFTTK